MIAKIFWESFGALVLFGIVLSGASKCGGCW